ncbi:hypothetical protein Acsp07_22070 [Actinomycetospora sp. NBRC 106378]|nr:hypothetical protein Acsp07_22070 [Actinomycetospora sp. NBRC 106378]
MRDQPEHPRRVATDAEESGSVQGREAGADGDGGAAEVEQDRGVDQRLAVHPGQLREPDRLPGRGLRVAPPLGERVGQQGLGERPRRGEGRQVRRHGGRR